MLMDEKFFLHQPEAINQVLYSRNKFRYVDRRHLRTLIGNRGGGCKAGVTPSYNPRLVVKSFEIGFIQILGHWCTYNIVC